MFFISVINVSIKYVKKTYWEILINIHKFR